MATFNIEIVETLSCTVEVQAEDLAAAAQKVKDLYYTNEVCLGAEDFVEVKFVTEDGQDVDDLL